MATNKKRQAVSPKTLGYQKQLFFVSGHLSEPVEGSTSWTFEQYADTGEQATRMSVAEAARYGLGFRMELCVYARGPRVKRGVASYNRIS